MKINISIILVLLFLLSACATNSSRPIDTYSLTSTAFQYNTQQPVKHSDALIIKLAPIRSAPSLSRRSIQYSDSEYGRNSYIYSRWSDAPAGMLQMLIQQTLGQTGQFTAVVLPVSALKADWLLEGNLYDFSHHLHQDGTSSGVIKIHFYIINNITKEMIATKDFYTEEPALSQHAKSAVAALNKAALTLSQDLAQWLNGMTR